MEYKKKYVQTIKKNSKTARPKPKEVQKMNKEVNNKQEDPIMDSDNRYGIFFCYAPALTY